MSLDASDKDTWFPIEINGDTWNIYLISNNDDLIDDGAAAASDSVAKEIYVRRESVTQAVIRHELWHAFFHYCYLADTNIRIHDAEEVSAALFADRGPKIATLAEEVYAKLRAMS